MLTDTQCRSLLKQAEQGTLKKNHSISDGRGLNLKNGKHWRLSYRFNGKQKTLALGVYPALTLEAARRARDQARQQLAQGIDPGEAKQEAKRRARQEAIDASHTFEAVAHEWYMKKGLNLEPRYRKERFSRLKNYVFPHVGTIPMTKLEPRDLIKALEHIHDRPALARKVCQLIGQICIYAQLMQYCAFNAAANLNKTLPDLHPVQHRKYLTGDRNIGLFVQAIDNYCGHPSTRYALRLGLMTVLRSKELRQSRWQYIKLERGEWTIPAELMKMNRPHTVYLSRQAISLLKELQDWTGGGEQDLVFPGIRTSVTPLSDMTLLNAIRRMGYGPDELDFHGGTRSTFSTWANSNRYDPDVIELCLAHTDRNKVRAAYNHAERPEDRRALLQDWSDYLDKMKEMVGSQSLLT